MNRSVSSTAWPNPENERQRAALAKNIGDQSVQNARVNAAREDLVAKLAKLSADELVTYVSAHTDKTHGRWDEPVRSVLVDTSLLRIGMEIFQPIRD